MDEAGTSKCGENDPDGTESDIQKSLELLDRVLSEFDDTEDSNLANEETKESAAEESEAAAESESSVVPKTLNVHTLPVGHQTEDDGYMSMNGKRAKFVLNVKKVCADHKELPPLPDVPSEDIADEMADYPPPPEEAERIISNLLPRVSPVNASRISGPGNNHPRWGKEFATSLTLGNESVHSAEIDESASTATQTTLPKTRHQRPYGWENSIGSGLAAFRLQDPPQPTYRFGSLPYEAGLPSARCPPPWLQKIGPLPPRTVPAAIDRHREVRRSNSGDVDSPRRLLNNYGEEEPTNFSDDSLEESLPPPPPPISKRESIAWEVPLGFDDEDALLTPGSTKVIGRRRRRSTEHSSNSSIHRLKEVEDWPEPPPSDDQISPFSDSIYDSNYTDDYGFPSALPLDITFNGTYVIRKGRRKERSPVKNSSFEMINAKSAIPVTYERKSSVEGPKKPDLKRASSTFDNIKLLLKDGLIEGINDAPPDFQPPNPPHLLRVVSLPTLPTEELEPEIHHRTSKSERYSKLNELGVTLEEAEEELSSLDNPSLNTAEKKTVGNQCCGLGENPRGIYRSISQEVETQTDLSDMECQNELEIVGKQIREISKTKSELDEVEKKIQEIVKIKTVIERQAREEFCDPWIKACDLQQPKTVSVIEERPPEEFNVNVEVLQHEFGPLPPSPEDEDGDEYSEIFHPSATHTPKGKADTLPEPFYRCHEPPGSDPSGKYLNRPPEPISHRSSDPVSNSLKTRSMDAGFNRGPRVYCSGSRRETGVERRTLPSEFPGAVSRRRTFQKRSSTSPQESMQTSCSLPETPIFTRGCDVPRTPLRQGPDSQRTSVVNNNSYRRNGPNTPTFVTGVSVTGGLNQAMAGAELLRMAGAPGRGWYPRHRQHRPASIEHLDRLPHSGSSPGSGLPGPWDVGSSRKPMTLPPNITPKFFHRSPREALRRVTSLLIRSKGSSSSRESRKESTPASTNRFGEPSEQTRPKKGFFRNFWKRSRHYSLDNQ